MDENACMDRDGEMDGRLYTWMNEWKHGGIGECMDAEKEKWMVDRGAVTGMIRGVNI